MQGQSYPRTRVTIERLTDAACILANRVGFHAISMNELASELCIRSPSLYTHVSGLEDVRRLIALKGLRDLLAQLKAAPNDGKEQMLALFDAYRRFALDNPGVYASILPTPPADDMAWRAALDDIKHHILQALLPFALDRAQSIHALRGLRSVAHGFVSLELAGAFKSSITNDESYRWLVACYLEGLAGQSSGGHDRK